LSKIMCQGIDYDEEGNPANCSSVARWRLTWTYNHRTTVEYYCDMHRQVVLQSDVLKPTKTADLHD
jgi:hypothetical protein